jgi:3-oxoadipate enol-lactonase
MTVDLAHEVHGAEGTPWVFLGASLGTTRAMWQAQLEPLARRYRVVRFDTRGHGESPVPAGPYAMGDLAADVLALADRLGAARFAYVGVSLGGGIGLQLAHDAPQRLSSLVLCCTAARFGEPATWTERAERVRRESTGWLVENNRPRWFTPALSGEPAVQAERLLTGIADIADEGYAGCCEAVAGFDARPWLGSVSVPTRVVAGAEDPATPAELTDELAAGIPGADLVTVAAASHLGVVERPEDFTSAILDHLAGSADRLLSKRVED